MMKMTRNWVEKKKLYYLCNTRYPLSAIRYLPDTADQVEDWQIGGAQKVAQKCS